MIHLIFADAEGKHKGGDAVLGKWMRPKGKDNSQVFPLKDTPTSGGSAWIFRLHCTLLANFER